MVTLHIYQRHCFLSLNSVSKKRPAGFDPRAALERLLEDVRMPPPHSIDAVRYTAVYDDAKGAFSSHFLSTLTLRDGERILIRKGGCDASSFLNLLDCISKDNLAPSDIVYIVEDDYVHRKGWINALVEGVVHGGAAYVTLYNHPDKYCHPMYNNLKSSLIVTPNHHWRTTPSTTNTYACYVGTLQSHMLIHQQFCELYRGFTNDHGKFLHLASSKGALVISCIPGLATHVEVGMLCPCVQEREWGLS